ncbi:MAG TPA: alkaline phosphatase family protein [Thermoanaerobaculia bacterium]|jgi:hypothetical protein
MDERRRALPFVLAGALAGVAAADVLIGLNPDLLAPASALRVLAVLGAIGAALAAPLAWLRKRPATRASTLLLALLLGLAAAGVEVQRRATHDFVPGGGRRVLVAAALALAAGAFLLVFAAGRGAPARPVAAVLVLLLLAPLAGRRAPERAVLASPEPLARAARRSLLVIGVEGISWDLLTAFASEGSLPTFARLLSEGAAGPLASLAPYDRAALWTSAATGKKPGKHGVVSEFRRVALSGTFRLLPVVPGLGRLVPPLGTWVREDGARRRSLTFWEILVARGHESAVLNWPCSAPARDGTVLWATDRFFAGDDGDDAARPAEAARRARLFRVSPGGLDRPLARALGPDGLPDGPARRDPPAAAARDLSVVGAALGALPAGPNNVAALVLSGLATAARLFGGAGDARYWGLAAPEGAEARARALKAYYRFLDDTLADVLEREGKERTICLFAPVGWGPPTTAEAVVRFVRGRVPGAGPDASRDGFVLLAGAGVRSGVRLTSAGVLDLAPTLLVLAGEPLARDMDGRVLAEAFDERFAEIASVPVITTFEPGGPQ